LNVWFECKLLGTDGDGIKNEEVDDDEPLVKNLKRTFGLLSYCRSGEMGEYGDWGRPFFALEAVWSDDDDDDTN